MPLNKVSLDNRADARTGLTEALLATAGDVNPVVDRVNSISPSDSTVYGKRNVISGSGATVALTSSQSGSLMLLDKADGIVITLPSASAGITFDFAVSVTCTSNSYKIITAAGTELMVGRVINCDTDTSDTVAIWKSLVGTSNISVNLNGTTKGGIKGDRITVTCLNSTTWLVEGITNGTNTVATPFATS
jgi:hypothetical protein